jgi:DNA-binding NarL/FixJ family response regulator
MNQRPTAVIVAPPGLLREGLRAALNALCRLEIVGEADTVAHAMAMVHDPTLVLLSVQGLDNHSPDVIGKLKSRWPEVRCVVLVETVAQQQAARAAGAEEVLVKGVRPSTLLRRIEGLLDEKQRTAPEGHPSRPQGQGPVARLPKSGSLM